jgi:osmotically-inducible protein OsmY
MRSHFKNIIAGLSVGLAVALVACEQKEPSPGAVGNRNAPSTTAPDNTGRNTRDRDGTTMTPIDQGNNASDIDLASRIRKEIVDAKLSTNASNVKVIANGGRVTLRGPVNSSDERARIVEIAERHAGAGNVTDEIEITNP